MLINNATYQRETLSERPIRQPLNHRDINIYISMLKQPLWRTAIESRLPRDVNGDGTVLIVRRANKQSFSGDEALCFCIASDTSSSAENRSDRMKTKNLNDLTWSSKPRYVNTH